MIWITADEHYGHRNILRYCDRPFDGVRDMDGSMILRFRELVSAGDTTYHVGDFCLAPADYGRRILDGLPGRHILVRGNHDPKGRVRRMGFGAVLDMAILDTRIGRVLLSHWPFYSNEEVAAHGAVGALCGHIHNRWRERKLGAEYPEVPAWNLNIGVDVRGFAPVPLEDAAAELASLTWRSGC